jgi:transcriptional regulator of acetoin/glycerol metabolism
LDYKERYYSIKKEWGKFIDGNPSVDNSIVSSAILSSWKRCKAIGVDPYLTTTPNVLPEDELKALLRENAHLISVCLPFMRTIYNFVEGSGFIVALFNHEGYLLEIVGDDDIVTSVQRGNFVPGACWSEENAGTNGCGTVIKTGTPMQIFAYNHYCRLAHRWTCSGSPIFDPGGKLVGVIDMTGPYDKAHPHTLGMVVAAAHAIENDLRAQEALADSEMADKFKKTVISSIPEALIATDNNGCISLINEKAKKMFKLRAGNIIGKHLNDIFGEKNDSFFNDINSNETLIDSEIAINMEGVITDFTVTINPILSPNNQKAGKIIILNELKRAKSLVTSMMGAKANFSFNDIIGANPDFVETLKQAKMASLSKSNVLLLGESGTGKDVFAQAIHNNGSRRNGPYIAINCAAIPRDLITSELFGYSEGAFTGSRRGGNPGKFELADGGTIFLDEIGETPLELQAILLRVIEDKIIMRIGGKNVKHVDVRIIAATNKNLRAQINKGLVREDLYYRLNVFTINMVPLNERKDDIPVLVDYFISKISSSMGKSVTKVSELVLEKFSNYSWPGNIRELQNVIERMVNISHAKELTIELVPLEILQNQQPMTYAQGIMSPKDLEHSMILKMMQSNLSKKEIARNLKIARSTLYRKLKKYNISSLLSNGT